MSNLEIFKYSLVWRKSRVSHFAQAPYRFLTEHEDISIFSFGGTSKNATVKMIFHLQNLVKCHKDCRGKGHSDHRPSKIVQRNYIQDYTNYPKSILVFRSDEAKLHSTQKPVALFEYLIKTYTNEGDLVLDNCIGSGTTAIAASNTNRRYIGMEKEKEYYDKASYRINHRQTKLI